MKTARSLRFALLAFTLIIFALQAESESFTPSDTYYSQEILGHWKWEMIEGDNSVTGVYTYQRDGKLIAEGMYSMNGRQIPIKLSGGWEIKDGTLVSTIKETNVPEMLPVGTVTKDNILEIEEAGFQYYSDDHGELGIRTRVFKSGSNTYESEFERTEKLAKEGDKEAQYKLGVRYCRGVYLSKDFKEAVKWYRMSAEQGDANAQADLGEMYNFGWGIPRDKKKALELYRKSAEQGNAKGQYYFANQYHNGQNFKEALKWYRKAAEQGPSANKAGVQPSKFISKAQAMLGNCYKHGLGVAKNPIEGYAWYTVAIANGDALSTESIKEIELSPEQLIEAQALSAAIQKRTVMKVLKSGSDTAGAEVDALIKLLELGWVDKVANNSKNKDHDKRIWEDASGKFKIEAMFKELKKGESSDTDIAVLEKSDGSLIQVPLKYLSSAGQDYIKKYSSSIQSMPTEKKIKKPQGDVNIKKEIMEYVSSRLEVGEVGEDIEKIKEPALSTCFAFPFYKTEITIPDVVNREKIVCVSTDTGLVIFSQPTKTKELPELFKLLNPEFTLKNEEDGQAMLSSFKAIYPLSFVGSVPRVEKRGKEWVFIIGEFFEKLEGFSAATDEQGKILSIGRSLSIEKSAKREPEVPENVEPEVPDQDEPEVLESPLGGSTLNSLFRELRGEPEVPDDEKRELIGAWGTVTVSPGGLKKLEEKFREKYETTDYDSNEQGKETLELLTSGVVVSYPHAVHFETVPNQPAKAKVRAWGTSKALEGFFSEVEDFLGIKVKYNSLKLLTETKTYPNFPANQFVKLGEELAKTMTPEYKVGSGGDWTESIYSKGLNSVNVKYLKDKGSLTLMIEGNRGFVDEIKSLLSKIKKPTP